VIAVAVLAGCGQSAGSEPRPAATAPAPAPTALVGGQGGPAFDPCVDIDDQVVRSVGFNPATREPKPAAGEYVAACQFDSAEMSLVVATAGTSFEEFKDRYVGARVGVDIDDRPAVVVRKPEVDLPCELAMKIDGGIVTLQTTLNVTAREWGMERCARIVDIATGIEPSIGR
jgi:hypothetical protein